MVRVTRAHLGCKCDASSAYPSLLGAGARPLASFHKEANYTVHWVISAHTTLDETHLLWANFPFSCSPYLFISSSYLPSLPTPTITFLRWSGLDFFPPTKYSTNRIQNICKKYQTVHHDCDWICIFIATQTHLILATTICLKKQSARKVYTAKNTHVCVRVCFKNKVCTVLSF